MPAKSSIKANAKSAKLKKGSSKSQKPASKKALVPTPKPEVAKKRARAGSKALKKKSERDSMRKRQNAANQRIDEAWDAVARLEKQLADVDDAAGSRRNNLLSARVVRSMLAGSEMNIVAGNAVDMDGVFGLKEEFKGLPKTGTRDMTVQKGSVAMLGAYIASVAQTVHRRAQQSARGNGKRTISSADMKAAIDMTNQTVFRSDMALSVMGDLFPARAAKSVATSAKTKAAS